MHAANTAQRVAQFLQPYGRALHQQDFQRLVVLQKDVLRGNDFLQIVRLRHGQLLPNAAAIAAVNKGDGTSQHLFGTRVCLVLGQRVANKFRNQLRARRQTAFFHHLIKLAEKPGLILLAGRYEGVDERLLEAEVDEQISIGDYVLSGGELPALVLTDAVSRLLPGVLGHQDSAEQDSFSGEFEHLLDCPHYTRPEVYNGQAVPTVLLSGNHALIRRWRLKQALGRTWQQRPDLLEARRARGLSNEEQQLLDEYIAEQSPHTAKTRD